MTPTPSTIYLSIAGFNIRINFHDAEHKYFRNKSISEIKNVYKGFIRDSNPEKYDHLICFIEKRNLDIFQNKYETNKYFINYYEQVNNKRTITYYHIGILQFQNIIRNILQRLLANNHGFILHASASNIQGNAYVFLGDTGAGKSTIMSLINYKYPSLADDSIILKMENRIYHLYQTPFIEKESWVKRNSTKYPLKEIFFLRKAKYYKIEKMENKDYILDRILKQFWTSDKTYAEKQMPYVFEFLSHFHNFYTLSFQKKKIGIIKLLTKEVDKVK